MRSPGINGEGELRGQPANPGSPGKMAVKTECVCVCDCMRKTPELQAVTVQQFTYVHSFSLPPFAVINSTKLELGYETINKLRYCRTVTNAGESKHQHQQQRLL